MNEIEIQNGHFGRSAFVIEDGHERLAEMEFSVKDGVMTVYHTEVASQLKGQGCCLEVARAYGALCAKK